MTAKQKADRLSKQQAFETDLIELYKKYAEVLTDDELSVTIQRFVGKVIDTGR